MKYIMTVDPSSRSMGVALWNARKWKIFDLPIDTRLFKGSKCSSWEGSSRCIGESLAYLMNTHQIIKVFCEQPAYMQGSHQSAAGGALVKLTHSAGMVAGMCYLLGCGFEYVAINKWKGNLPKSVVNDRIREIILDRSGKQCVFQQDEWDAVGIGFYLKGVF